MVKCDKCGRSLKKSHTKSGVIQSVYYKSLCGICISENSQVSSGDAQWQRTIDSEDHEAEIQQPWRSDGSPNPKFIALYRDKAAHIFTEDEMRKAI